MKYKLLTLKMVVILGTKDTIDVIPLNMFGSLLRDIINRVIQQIAARDYQDPKYTFDPKIMDQLIGIDKSVFSSICTSEQGFAFFDNVHIFDCQNNINYVGV
jgi:hypothetical protein